MRSWNLSKNDPLNLIIAADASLTSTCYVDDQIWELFLEGGEPSALALHTTYGLRANSLRLFPQFSDDNISVSDSNRYVRFPIVTKILPNYLQVDMTPLPNVDVLMEYLVPHSQGCCGRITFTNTSDQEKTIRFEWIGILSPRNGKRLAHQEIDDVHTLTGSTENIYPVIYLSKGAQPGQGPFPSLSLPVKLIPGEHCQIFWTQAALATIHDSFQLARSMMAFKWDAEIARVEINQSRKLDIRMDDNNWDATIMLSQKVAFGLIHSSTKHLPNCSFVSSRVPDQGFSLLEDGSDYNFLWNGQTALDALFLSGCLLPSDVAIVEGIFHNFLSIQAPNGFIDWKPGLAGQRSHLQVTPILASLARRVYEVTQDRNFIELAFEPLYKYYLYWMQGGQDFDQDGVPEWDHILQMAFDDHPKYAAWSNGSDGLDISTVETPGLVSILFKEGEILAEFAQILGKDHEKDVLLGITRKLKKDINKFFNQEKHTFSDRDRDTHLSLAGIEVLTDSGNGAYIIKQPLKPRARLVISISNDGSHISRPKIKIFGKDKNRKTVILDLQSKDFRWYMSRGIHTTEQVFTFINKIIIDGLDPSDLVNIHTPDFGFTDITQYLPLWAGILDQATADQIINTCLRTPEGILAEHGLKTYKEDNAGSVVNDGATIHPIWTIFFLEGLVNYGYRIEAAELMRRYIQLIIKQVRSEKAFRHSYHSVTGNGIGEKNHVLGIVPIDCFLRILGVKFISGFQVQIEGHNPYPWPVKVNYQGITVVRQSQLTTIVFPDGQTTQIADPTPRIVSWEHGDQEP